MKGNKIIEDLKIKRQFDKLSVKDRIKIIKEMLKNAT